MNLKEILFVVTIVLINIKQEPVEQKENNLKNVEKPFLIYGIPADSFLITNGQIKKNQTLGMLLYSNHVTHSEIHEAVLCLKEMNFDVRDINAGNKYTILSKNDSIAKAQYFVYEEDPINYIVFDLREKIKVYRKS